MGWISRVIPKWLRAQPSETIRPQISKPHGSNQHLNAPSPPMRASLPIPPGSIPQGGNVGSTGTNLYPPDKPARSA